MITDTGELKEAFLAVVNTQPSDERLIAKNAERVVTARLRDAKFFWDADRKIKLEDRLDRLHTIVFHKKLRQLPRQGGAHREARRHDRDATSSAPRTRRSHGGGDGGPARQGRSRHRHGVRVPRAAGRDGRHLRARARGCRSRSGRRSTTTTCRWASKPTRRRRARSSAQRRGDVGGGVAGGQGRHARRRCSAPARSRPGRAIPSACAATRTGCSRSSSISPELTGPSTAPITRRAGRRTAANAAAARTSRSGRSCSNASALSCSSSAAFDRAKRARRDARRRRRAAARSIARRKLEVLPRVHVLGGFKQLATAFKRVRNIARELPVAVASEPTYGGPRPSRRKSR